MNEFPGLRRLLGGPQRRLDPQRLSAAPDRASGKAN